MYKVYFWAQVWSPRTRQTLLICAQTLVIHQSSQDQWKPALRFHLTQILESFLFVGIRARCPIWIGVETFSTSSIIGNPLGICTHRINEMEKYLAGEKKWKSFLNYCLQSDCSILYLSMFISGFERITMVLFHELEVYQRLWSIPVSHFHSQDRWDTIKPEKDPNCFRHFTPCSTSSA